MMDYKIIQQQKSSNTDVDVLLLINVSDLQLTTASYDALSLSIVVFLLYLLQCKTKKSME